MFTYIRYVQYVSFIFTIEIKTIIGFIFIIDYKLRQKYGRTHTVYK